MEMLKWTRTKRKNESELAIGYVCDSTCCHVTFSMRGMYCSTGVR